MEIRQGVVIIIQIREDSSFDYCGKKWQDFRCILKVQLFEFVDGLEWYVRKRSEE